MGKIIYKYTYEYINIYIHIYKCFPLSLILFFLKTMKSWLKFATPIMNGIGVDLSHIKKLQSTLKKRRKWAAR